jgi:ABC-type uncharacterized transport system substrate-binding protein
VITRRIFIGMVGGGFLATSLNAEAQRTPVRARIAVFFSGSPQTAFEHTWGRSFVSALRNLGWVEGQNLVLEWWYSEDHDERRRALAADFVRRKLDVIVVQSTTETVEMKRATATIPIVMVLIGDPVGAGLVQSLARPGGNITGTSLMTSETYGKGVQFLKELLPTARRVAVLGNTGNASVCCAASGNAEIWTCRRPRSPRPHRLGPFRSRLAW